MTTNELQINGFSEFTNFDVVLIRKFVKFVNL
jgi:hypothetical protein